MIYKQCIIKLIESCYELELYENMLYITKHKNYISKKY